MGNIIRVDEESLKKLKAAFEKAGQDYISNLAKLEKLVQDITNGDIEGTIATELVTKFNDKKEIFNKISETINDGFDYMGIKNKGFDNAMNDIASSLR